MRTGPLGINNLTTYKWQLQLLRRVSVFHDELAECLPDAMTNSVFGSLVIIVIGEIELILGMRIQPVTLPKPERLSCKRNQRRSTQHVGNEVPGKRSSGASSSLSSRAVKSRKGAVGLQIILWVQEPDSRALFVGFVRLLSAGTDSCEWGWFSCSNTICSSQFESRIRSRDLSPRRSGAGRPEFSRS